MAADTLALIILSVSLSAAAQVSFKFGLLSIGPLKTSIGGIASALLTPGVMLGLVFYGVGTLMWLSALSRIDLSQAYPFVGLGFAFTTLAGWWLFGETLTLTRLLGISSIFVGIVLIGSGR